MGNEIGPTGEFSSPVFYAISKAKMTALTPPAIANDFLRYADIQIDRHLFTTSESTDEDAFVEMEDEMLELWGHFTEPQRVQLNGMGADLNWIARKGGRPPCERPADQVAVGEFETLLHAWQSSDWFAVLDGLRVCAPVFRAEILMEWRASLYRSLGLNRYADELESLVVE